MAKTPTFLQVKNIVDTLPIGFYANRRIACTLVEDAKCSCYDPLRDNIKISYPQICSGLDKVSENELELMIRSNYYHEISHAILTPKDMPATKILNIFEDERIETLLKNFYYDVDFKKSIMAICNFDPTSPPATDPLDAFFDLVRFRKGPKNFTDRVEQIIKNFKHLNRNSYYSITWLDEKKGTIAEGWYQYKDAVYDLYQDFTKALSQLPPQEFEISLDLSNDMDTSSNPENKNTPTPPLKQSSKGKGEYNSEMSVIFDKVTNNPNFFNPEFHKEVKLLFENFKRKNSKGNALQGYSGILNPRIADRPDYKIFERSTTSKGNNQFGTFHLNLFIDNSGSYENNVDATNCIIKSLIMLENSNSNFTFDVVAMEVGEELKPKDDRFIGAYGGNYLSKDIFSIYRKLQLPQTYNYNIVLFDGDAYSANGSSFIEAYIKQVDTLGEGFLAFANQNCSIISDSDNKDYINKFCPNTKTIYTADYVNELSKNILKILKNALN